MKRILPPLLLPTALLAAEWTVDLRAPDPAPGAAPAETRAAAPAADDGCLRSSALPAGSASTGALAPGDTLDLLLFDGKEIRVTLVERSESPLGGDVFLGEAEGSEGVASAVVLRTDDGLTVDVQDFANGRVWAVVSDADGVAVREIEPAAGTEEPPEPEIPERPAPAPASDGEPSASGDQASTLVDVLVAYDAPAAAWARQNSGGITNFATMAVGKMNTAMANCGLSSEFRFRLVGVATVEAEGGTDFNGVLDKTMNGIGVWAPVKAKRDEVGADVVTTMIDTGAAHGTTGLGYSLRDLPVSSFSEYAYNVCAVRAVAQSHTMTHETGHNIGAGHASAVDPGQISPGPQLYGYSAGYHFTGNDGVAYHTIMAYYYDGFGNTYTPVPFFSSPDLAYAGVPLGDATHDNVRTIRETYADVSKWRSQKIPMSYDVFFTPEDGSTFTGSITVELAPGKTGLPIRYTLDGSTPTANSTPYTGPITLTQTTTIRAVTVTDGVPGPVFEATYSVSDLGNGVDAPQLVWTTSPDWPWTFQTDLTHDGVDAVRSALFSSGNDSGPTWLKTTVAGPTRMSFRYRKNFYSSSFSVTCDSDTLYSDTATGTSSEWSLVELDIPAGTHEVKFSFRQGGYYTSAGNYVFNGIWLDTVQFDALSRPPTISPATTDDESTATAFQGSLSVSLSPPEGKHGALYYTIDGSDPTGTAGLVYDGPFELTRSTRVRTVFVEGGMEPSVEVGGLYLERHPVRPGEWTTDVEGAKAAAAQDGALIAVLCANRAGCWWSQQFYPVAESPEFLAWSEANGVYLVTGDTSCNPDARTAQAWFSRLRSDYGDSGILYYPTIFFARPSAPDAAIGKGLARNDNSSLVGTELYLDTVESLIAGFASVLGETVPQAPTCSRTDTLVDAFPISVTLSNPNGSGTIRYTLDGTLPTRYNGTGYTSGTIVVSGGDVLQAAVWPSSGPSSPVFVGAFKTIAEVLGTTGIVWARSGTRPWRTIDEPATLRAGGLMDGTTYSSTLQGSVEGKGKLVFSYAFNSSSWQNSFEFSKNGTQQFRYAYDGTRSRSGTVTNEVASEGTTTFAWTVTVDNASYDYDDRYTVPSGVWLSGVRWIPARDGVEVEGVFLSGEWFAEHFPAVATDAATRTAIAEGDTDGDGFENWKECLCGTDPNDAADHLRATIRMEDGEPVVEWNLTDPLEGATCVVEGVESLPAAESDWTSPPPAGASFFRVRATW